MSRLPLLTPEQLSEDQQRLYEAIVGGERGGDAGRNALTTESKALIGPFNSWLFSPRTGMSVSKLGETVRFSNSLPKNALEIAILVTARRWRALFEWWAHERIARRHGVDQSTIDAIMDGQRPQLADPAEQLVYDFATQLLDTGGVDDDVYERTRYRFGEHGIVDLVTLLGYYGLVSMTLNVFQVPLPEGEEVSFPS